MSKIRPVSTFYNPPKIKVSDANPDRLLQPVPCFNGENAAFGFRDYSVFCHRF